jgi:transposase
MEELVAQGLAKVIGTETTHQLGYQRAGFVDVVIDRVKYSVVNKHGLTELETAPVPPQLLSRCLATPSTLAHIATSKFADGLPLYRQQDILARDGGSLARGTMSRWLKELGSSLGTTVVAAMDRDARANAFCILTDATGFAIQPGPFEDPNQKKRRPCRKGHYFVRIADQDHVLFDYVPRHTGAAVYGLFKDFDGFIQADASSIYDLLFRSEDEWREDDLEHDGCSRIEVGCWSHARRKYWEAAMAKSDVARAALLRIGKIYDLDEALRRGRPPPSKIKLLRDTHLRPLVDEFLTFAKTAYDKVKAERGSLSSALGYTVRQAGALRAFLQDPRLRLDNNPSESKLRKVVRIRDAAFFAGSDEHAESAAALLSLLASAALHRLDPERYLRDVIRLLPFWPADRHLELAPKNWGRTRETLDGAQLDAEVGVIDVPQPGA